MKHVKRANTLIHVHGDDPEFCHRFVAHEIDFVGRGIAEAWTHEGSASYWNQSA